MKIYIYYLLIAVFFLMNVPGNRTVLFPFSELLKPVIGFLFAVRFFIKYYE